VFTLYIQPAKIGNISHAWSEVGGGGVFSWRTNNNFRKKYTYDHQNRKYFTRLVSGMVEGESSVGVQIIILGKNTLMITKIGNISHAWSAV
jgi:hypothetical protein